MYDVFDLARRTKEVYTRRVDATNLPSDEKWNLSRLCGNRAFQFDVISLTCHFTITLDTLWPLFPLAIKLISLEIRFTIKKKGVGYSIREIRQYHHEGQSSLAQRAR